ncbi:hypothetical protein JQS43_17575 [Natronosporangium hydrolyticum]|uniref:Uncharacterized protein n=1 Tax=Natronosporangium hydrolyticum TaxID=2811111 RepID=A0A895YAU8_9ACTN|nr:hypothetical protein [Natronosporangium hydrolyticum]QSB13415.1 hypothetical protein JQS43_17575 [Natronosporangium hydrolyticum]
MKIPRGWVKVGAALLSAGALGGVALVAGFSAWPRTEVVAQTQVTPQPAPVEGAGPAEVVLHRRWSFFGLRERYTLFAGRSVVIDTRPLTLCGTTYPVADPGEPATIEAAVAGPAGYDVSFGSGEVVTVPEEAMTHCR